MGEGPTRQRGEGNAEYVILLSFVMICAVVGLFTSYSGSIKKMQLEKGLCLDCSNRDKDKLQPKPDATANNTTPSNSTASNGTGTLPSGTSAALPPTPPSPPWWDLVSWFWG